jgi:S1-C subfamily serine protease
MWRTAYKKILYSVHAVLLETPKSGTQPKYWQTIGTSFSIKGKPNPLLITNAHVVCNENGIPYNEKHLALAAIMPEGKAGVAGVGIRFIEKSLDIAVFEVSKEALDIVPATFAKPAVLEIGTAVASVGFPIPPKPKLRLGGGSLTIIKRLATGFISTHDMKPEFDRESSELKHYEINMLSYPGLSGAPVFDIKGLVIGINRGNILISRDNFAAYAYAIRGPEIIEYLEKNNIKIEINST